MGKSMILKYKNDGGQNPIEAAKLNCKIYHGPYVANFGDIYEILANNNISTKIDDHNELSKNLAIDFEHLDSAKDKNKIAINSLGQKTLHDTMKLVNNFINYENK
jgi:3-deoxy-D-manno-octulosonic-acid transferase